MSGDPVPAITEAEARGETAEIFADLRATLGVNVVNLIWRHFATFPGALAWAWRTLKPLYVAGRVEAEARALKDALVLPDRPRWPGAMLACARVDAAGAASIRQVLASYNRSNAMNLVALSALVRCIDGAPAASTAPTAPTPAANDPAGEPALAGALPRLLRLDEVDAETAALILAINLLGDRVQGRIVASMYRHLAHWPGYLALCHAHLAPLDADGRLARLIERTIALGAQAGARLQAGVPALPAPDSASEVRRAADDFLHNAIGRMVPVALLLLAVLPGERAA